MLGLYSYTEMSHSLLKIADPEILVLHGYNLKSLRLALQARAHQFQESLPIWSTESTVIVESETTETQLRKLFAGPSELNDLGQATVIGNSFNRQERTFKVRQVRDALDLLKNLDVNLYEIFNVVIACIFTSHSKSAGGGTSSATPGVIWANLQNSWSTWDTLEFLVHELTHNLLFFDEFSHLHYKNHNALSSPESFAQSAILKRQRPLDKVLHSIFVGISILNLRANSVFQQLGLHQPIEFTAGVHPRSAQLTEQIKNSIASIFANKNATQLLSDRGQELLNRARKRVDEFAGVCGSLAI